jgi:tetratricopeptide (TPR) repeat protein
MTRWLRPLALLLLCAAPITLPVSPSSAQPAASAEALDAEARSLFEAGRTAYRDARYEDALGYYRRSYELSHRPELLYNIGQCEDRLRHDAEAIEAFEAFLAALPDAPQRAEVTVRLDILRRTAVATTDTETTETPETIVATPAPVDASASDPVPWIVLGVGGGLAAVGVALLIAGYVQIGDVESARNVPFSSVSGAYDAAPILTGTGWAALGVGVALAGIGAVWVLSGGSSSRSSNARLRLNPTGLTLSGSF